MPVPAELRERIEASMAKYPDFRSAAIPALHAAQDVHGWCSPEAIEQVACVMRLTPAYLTAVATFYDMFSTVPVGRQTVYVCTNISCSLRGADELYAAMQEAAGDDADFNVRAFECLGACDIAPMASVNGAYVGPLELADAETIVAQLRAGEEVLPDKQLLRRKVADPRAASGGDAGDAASSASADAEHASPEAEHNASAAKAPDADHSDAADRLFPDERVGGDG
jgi:NADH:ubiquinone oxidoreductase subunit E